MATNHNWVLSSRPVQTTSRHFSMDSWVCNRCGARIESCGEPRYHGASILIGMLTKDNTGGSSMIWVHGYSYQRNAYSNPGLEVSVDCDIELLRSVIQS